MHKIKTKTQSIFATIHNAKPHFFHRSGTSCPRKTPCVREGIFHRQLRRRSCIKMRKAIPTSYFSHAYTKPVPYRDPFFSLYYIYIFSCNIYILFCPVRHTKRTARQSDCRLRPTASAPRSTAAVTPKGAETSSAG